MLAALLERWSTQLPRAVAALIVLTSLVMLGAVIWRWQHQLGAATSAAVRSGGSATEAVDPLPVILSGNVFGSQGQQAGGGEASGAARAATGYTLRAALAGPTGAGGAIIEASGSEARWYAAGDTLADGAKLKEVHPDHVILERNGALERLEFPRLADMPTTVAANTTAGAGAGAASDTSVESGRAEPIPADAAPDEKARLIRQRLEELRNRSRT